MRPRAHPPPEGVSLPKHCQSPGHPTPRSEVLFSERHPHHPPAKGRSQEEGCPPVSQLGLPRGVGFGEKTGPGAGGGASAPTGPCPPQHCHCRHQSSVACTLCPTPAGGGRAPCCRAPALCGSRVVRDRPAAGASRARSQTRQPDLAYLHHSPRPKKHHPL